MTLVLIGLIGIAGCAAQVRPAFNDGEIERTVEESLLQYLIAERYPPRGRTVCVGFRVLGPDAYETRDPTSRQLSRIQALGETAVPASECRLRDSTGPMIHSPTGLPAVKYEVTLVRRDTDHAELFGAWYAASLAGEECTYAARNVKGIGWEFTTEERCIAS